MNSENCEMYRLGLSQSELEEYKKDEVAANTFNRELFSRARKMANSKYCYFCKKKISSFCKSHSVPRFCLKRIADNGKVYFSGLQTLVPFLGEDTGVSDAGTFRIICRECDGRLFQDYENPNAYDKEISGDILAEIALKDYLQIISKRLQERSLYSIICEEHPRMSAVAEAKLNAISLDLSDYSSAYDRAKMAVIGNHDFFYLCYYKKLDYVVPLAFQGAITLVSDFEDNVINNIYNCSPTYHTEDIHIAVFPLEAASVILAFVDTKSKRYRQFYKQLNRLSEEDQLAAINYIIHSYSENVFLSKNIDEKVMKDRAFLDVCRKSGEMISFDLFQDVLSKAVEEYSLSKRNTIPNLLSKENQLRPSNQMEQDN